ncbi:hypothetical protein [Pontixanthobacter aquaemixtae]|nr:hypothetical protein [Pontixanthobacter aquaemixtae]
MTNFAQHFAAAVAAITIATLTIVPVVTVPAAQAATVIVPALA